MARIFSYILILLTASSRLSGQDSVQTVFSLVATYPFQAEQVMVDQLRESYLINGKNLHKLNAQGELIYTWEENRRGQLQQLDAYLPLKALAYYPEFAEIVLLDKTLSEISRIDLFSLDYQEVSAACVSWDRNIWLYDNFRRRLDKINDAGQRMLQSEDLALWLDEVPYPTFMKERNNKLYLLDPDKGIFIFDTYGTYEKRLNITGISDFQINGNRLSYWKDGMIRAYDLRLLQYFEADIPDPEDVVDISIQPERLYVLRSKRLDIYRFSELKKQ